MIQLSYQPSFDPFHALFRALRLRHLLLEVETSTVSVDCFRIVDFYLVFPFRMQDVRFAPSDRKFKKIAKNYDDLRPYGRLPDNDVLFSRMKPFQMAALETAVSTGFFDYDLFKKNKVKFREAEIQSSLKEKIIESNAEQRDLCDVFCNIFSKYSTFGVHGLKSRTGLLDFKYDIV